MLVHFTISIPTKLLVSMCVDYIDLATFDFWKDFQLLTLVITILLNFTNISMFYIVIFIIQNGIGFTILYAPPPIFMIPPFIILSTLIFVYRQGALVFTCMSIPGYYIREFINSPLVCSFNLSVFVTLLCVALGPLNLVNNWNTNIGAQ